MASIHLAVYNDKDQVGLVVELPTISSKLHERSRRRHSLLFTS